MFELILRDFVQMHTECPVNWWLVYFVSFCFFFGKKWVRDLPRGPASGPRSSENAHGSEWRKLFHNYSNTIPSLFRAINVRNGSIQKISRLKKKDYKIVISDFLGRFEILLHGG